MDKYVARYIKEIKAGIKDDCILEKLINKIYEDGFYDGSQFVD